MSDLPKFTAPDGAAQQTLANLVEIALAITSNKQGAKLLAATPVGRQTLLDIRQDQEQQKRMLRKASRALTAADAAIGKAVKARRWGVAL